MYLPYTACQTTSCSIAIHEPTVVSKQCPAEGVSVRMVNFTLIMQMYLPYTACQTTSCSIAIHEPTVVSKRCPAEGFSFWMVNFTPIMCMYLYRQTTSCSTTTWNQQGYLSNALNGQFTLIMRMYLRYTARTPAAVPQYRSNALHREMDLFLNTSS